MTFLKMGLFNWRRTRTAIWFQPTSVNTHVFETAAACKLCIELVETGKTCSRITDGPIVIITFCSNKSNHSNCTNYIEQSIELCDTKLSLCVKNQNYSRDLLRLNVRPLSIRSQLKSAHKLAEEICARYKSLFPNLLNGHGRQLSPRKSKSSCLYFLFTSFHSKSSNRINNFIAEWSKQFILDNVDMACIAACADREMSRVYYLMDSIAEAQFPPGTSCSSGHLQGTRSFCVAGQCVQFDERNRLQLPTNQSKSLIDRLKSINQTTARLIRTKRSHVPTLKPIKLSIND